MTRVVIAGRTNLKEEMRYSGLLFYDMGNHRSKQSQNFSKPLMGWVIAERPAMEGMMRYKGLLL